MTDNNYDEENIKDVFDLINQEKEKTEDNKVFTVLEKYR